MSKFLENSNVLNSRLSSLTLEVTVSTFDPGSLRVSEQTSVCRRSIVSARVGGPRGRGRNTVRDLGEGVDQSTGLQGPLTTPFHPSPSAGTSHNFRWGRRDDEVPSPRIRDTLTSDHFEHLKTSLITRMYVVCFIESQCLLYIIYLCVAFIKNFF